MGFTPQEHSSSANARQTETEHVTASMIPLIDSRGLISTRRLERGSSYPIVSALRVALPPQKRVDTSLRYLEMPHSVGLRSEAWPTFANECILPVAGTADHNYSQTMLMSLRPAGPD